MTTQIINVLIGIAALLYIPYAIYFNAVHFRSIWKCRKKHYDRLINRCNEKDCKWAPYCEKYLHVYTDEEVAVIRKLIEELKN